MHEVGEGTQMQEKRKRVDGLLTKEPATRVLRAIRLVLPFCLPQKPGRQPPPSSSTVVQSLGALCACVCVCVCVYEREREDEVEHSRALGSTV